MSLPSINSSTSAKAPPQTSKITLPSSGEGGANFVGHKTQLARDLNVFYAQLVEKKPSNSNIVVSPFLIKRAIACGEKIDPYITRYPSKNTDNKPVTSQDSEIDIKGLHVFSKRAKCDEVLTDLGYPYTKCSDLMTDSLIDAAVLQINKIIENDTDNMIKDFIKPDKLKDPDTLYLLTTWLFKKITWGEPFKLLESKEQKPTWDGEERPDIQWMKTMKNDQRIGYIAQNNLQLASLPVKEQHVKTIFILPDQSVKTPTEESLLSIISSCLKQSDYNSDYKLILPKFKADYEFEKDSNPYPDLKRSERHKAAIDVDENGVKLAAASMLCITAACMPPRPPKMVIDRPFFFGIIDTHNQKDPRVLAMAYIHNPAKS